MPQFSDLDDCFIHHVVDTGTEVVVTGDDFSQKLKIYWRATLSFLQKNSVSSIVIFFECDFVFLSTG